MIEYQLPEPFYGETHVQFYEILETPGSSIRLTGNLGSLDEDGEFEANPDLPSGFVKRTISGDEFESFLEDVDSRRAGSDAEGTPNFRHDDLIEWVGKTELTDRLRRKRIREEAARG